MTPPPPPPSRANKICPRAGCNTVIKGYEEGCPRHPNENTGFRNKVHHKRHDFYQTQPWRKLSKAHKKANPLCVDCLKENISKLVQVTDHIVSIEQDWSLRLKWDNLQSLCHSHHNAKTARENAKNKQ